MPEKSCRSDKTGKRQQNPSVALQAKSFSYIITSEPQPVLRGLMEERRRERGQSWEKIGFLCKRLPRCPGV